MAPSENFEWASFTDTIHRSAYPAIDPTNPANSASGKVVIVTGGGSGIGLGIAKAFVTAGAKGVVILGRRENVLHEAKKELESTGSSKILTFVADVVDEAALDRAFSSATDQVGAPDVVVGNAGYLAGPGNAATADVDDYWKSFEVNIKGTLLTYRAFHKYKGDKEGVFISLNSGAAHDIYPGLSSYPVAKIAQANLIPHFAKEDTQIRSVSMHPGVILTDMNRKSGMALTLDDISLPSSFAVWLTSPRASWTSGLFLHSHWDIDELEKLKSEIAEKDLLRMNLTGYPRVQKPKVLV